MALLKSDVADVSSSLRFSTGDSFVEAGITLTGGITVTQRPATNPDMASSLRLTSAGT